MTARRARIHRKVEVDTWQSPDFRALSAPKPNAQTLWLWLLTSERTVIVPGVVVARPAVMADDLRWPIRGFNAALAELEAAGMVEVDREAGLLVLTKALLVDGRPRDGASPSSVNAAKSWATTLLKLPLSPLRDVVRARAEAVISRCKDEIRSAFAETIGTACARQADADRTPSGLRDQGTDTREDPETHTAREAPVNQQPEHGDRKPSPDLHRQLAEKLYDRHAAALRELASGIPGCPSVIVGGLPPPRTLAAIGEVVRHWLAEAAAAGVEQAAHVSARMEQLLAVRVRTARDVGHVKWWASSTFWDPANVERDLLQSPEQATAAVRARASPVPQVARGVAAAVQIARRKRAEEQARHERTPPDDHRS